MDLASKYGKMVVVIRVISWITCFTVKEFFNILMAIYIKVNGLVIYIMDKESTLAKAVDIMKAVGFQAKGKGTECKYGKTDKCTRDNLKKDIKTVKER